MTTALDLETSALEALDFDITCQTVRSYIIGGVKLHEHPNCNRPATHSASIHQAGDCTVIEKFICAACIGLFLNDRCLNCTETCRISNLVPLPKTP